MEHVLNLNHLVKITLHKERHNDSWTHVTERRDWRKRILAEHFVSTDFMGSTVKFTRKEMLEYARRNNLIVKDTVIWTKSSVTLTFSNDDHVVKKFDTNEEAIKFRDEVAGTISPKIKVES